MGGSVKVTCNSGDCAYLLDGTSCGADEITIVEDGGELVCGTYKLDKKKPWICRRCKGDILDCQCI